MSRECDETPEIILNSTVRREMGINTAINGQHPFVVTNVSEINRKGPLEVRIWYTLSAEQTTRLQEIIKNSDVPCVIIDDRETIAKLDRQRLAGMCP